MFTGFASENTPAIQVWDCYIDNTPALNVGLADDCAPIQFFRTGATTTDIQIYLPTAPIEGKLIKIINSPFNSNKQYLNIKLLDASRNGSFNILSIGPGQYLDLCYTKQVISPMNWGFNYTGLSRTGWIPLNIGGTTAINSYAFAVGFRAAALEKNSAVIGGDANQALVSNSAVVGGSTNTASQSNAFVGGGSSNTASGTNSAVVGGSSNSASNTNAFVGGGTSNIASGQHTFVGGGSGNLANQSFSAVIGGGSNQATAQLSSVFGGANGSTRSIQGYTVFPASDGPVDAQVGKQQLATLLIGRQTTGATATVLTSNTGAAGTDNQVILPNNSAYFFRGEVIAGKTAAGDAKGWTIEGVIKRGANAASTTLVGSTVTSLYADAGAATWSIAVTADTTNGGLKVEVTGQAATTIRWVAQIRTTETAF